MRTRLAITILSLFAVTNITAAAPASPLPTFTHTGMCDASAAAALGTNYFAAANDEDNVINIYRLGIDGGPVRRVRLDSFLRVDPKEPEVDLEGGVRIGDRIYWISSHGRNKDGKPRPSRQRIFATDVQDVGGVPNLTPVGQPYALLLQDLFAHAPLAAFDLRSAAEDPPKQKGALNIEGFAAGPNGSLLVGFRNPIPKKKALIVPILNPEEVIKGTRAKLGSPHLLDLGGLGVRDMLTVGETIYVLAGPHRGGPPHRVFAWDGKSSTATLVQDLGGFNGEALFQPPGVQGLWALSDEGSRKEGKLECKDLKIPELKTFRSMPISLRAHAAR